MAIRIKLPKKRKIVIKKRKPVIRIKKKKNKALPKRKQRGSRYA